MQTALTTVDLFCFSMDLMDDGPWPGALTCDLWPMADGLWPGALRTRVWPVAYTPTIHPHIKVIW